MTDLTVANTIKAQLGGRRFEVMTGAKNFLGDNNSLQFQIGKNNTRCNRVKITLTVDDTYTVEFFYVTLPRVNKKGFVEGGVKTLKVAEDIYNDNLCDCFTNFTGLYTSLGR